MPANDKIFYSDFNTLQNTISSILGTGSASYGYGQRSRSVSVSGASGTGAVFGGGSSASYISTNEYTLLRSDIISIHRHIYGTDPNPADPVLGQIVRFVITGADTAEFNSSEFNVAEYNATSIANSNDPYNQFITYVNDLQNSRFTCATSQSNNASKGSVTRVSAWGGGNATISARVRVEFTSSNDARYFFNSGGNFQIAASRSGGTAKSQNTSWTSLLSGAGTQIFSAQLPSSTLSGTAGTNWFTLTSAYQTWYSVNATGVYGTNQYRIMARTLDGLVANNNSGTSAGVDFLVVFQDSYQDPPVTNSGGSSRTSAEFPPDDGVDGTLTVTVARKKAVGTLHPDDAAFTVAEPTVTYFGGGSGSANSID